MTDLEQLRTRAAQWTLADDSKLISAISSLVDSMLERGRALDASLLSTSSAISHLHSSIDTAESAIGLYSGTQFIEQRVMDDDYRPRRPSQPAPSISLEERQSIILGDIRAAMRDGLHMIDKSFRRLGDESDPFIQYEPIDRYNRWIPPMIGSDAFHAMGKRKKREREPISIAVDQPKSVSEPSSSTASSVHPSPSSNPFVGISAFPPVSPAPPPPPPPPMPAKASPLGADRSALHAEITSALNRGGDKKGEFRVPHDDGPQDVDAGLTPPLPPRSSLHASHPGAVPILPPRGSVQHAEPPELPPKRDEKPSTSVPLPAEPKKKSIFDFDSDDDDFAAVLSRPTKPLASSSTLSSSMRSNESDSKSLPSQEEKTEPPRNQGGPQSVLSELAAAAASKRAQQLAGGSSAPPLPPRTVEKKADAPLDSPFNPLATSTPAVRVEQKKEEEQPKPAVKKQLWAPPKKSIFDDEDSDFDELFKPPPKKKEEAKKEEPKKVEVKKVEEKKTVEAFVQPPKPATAAKQPDRAKRRNLFDSDSDLEDFLKPKASVAKPPPKKEEPPQAAKAAENPLEQPLSNQEKARKEEERSEQKREQKEATVEHKSADRIAPPPVVDSPKPAEPAKPDPITAQSEVSKEQKEEKEKKEEEQKREEKTQVPPSSLPIAPLAEQTKVAEEEQKEQPEFPREEKAFTPLRESPPPFAETPIAESKSTRDSPVSPPRAEKAAVPGPVKKESSVHFDSPPPFVQPEEEPTEERDQRDSSGSEDSDTEAMQGNRAAFMAQLNAKLAAKPPTGMGIRPVSMIETSSTPFVAPSVDRSSVVPPATRRATSETKPEGPLSHANKSRPRGPARRPPTTIKVTSSSDSEDAAKASPKTVEVPRSLPPKSPVAASPVKDSPVVFRKTSDPKSPPASISRKSSSSSSLGPDGDPLSALSAVHTSPYKTGSGAKPPTAPMSRMSVSSVSTSKSETPPASTSTDNKAKKSIFDSDSDDFYEKFGGAKTLPAKSSAFKNELESALKKDKKVAAPSTQKKGLFDDSDEDLDMFRKKK